MDKINMRTTSRVDVNKQPPEPESTRGSPPTSPGASQPQPPQQHDRPGRERISKAAPSRVRSQSAEPNRKPSIFRSIFRNATNVARKYNNKANTKYDPQIHIDPPINGPRDPNKPHRGGRPRRRSSFAHPPSKRRHWQGEPIPGPGERNPPTTAAGKTDKTDEEIDDETTARILASPNHSDPVISQINAMVEDEDDQAPPPKLGPVKSVTFDIQMETEDTDKNLSEPQQQLDDKDELIQHLKNELQQKEESLAIMQKKAADAEAKAADIPPALVLLRSEEELINGWNDLAHEIHNFVRGYLKNADRKNREKWMATNKRKLKEIAPSYKKIAADSKHVRWLIEALIWKLLCRTIFGSSTNEAPIAWGGRYGELLSELGSALMERLEPEDERFQRLYHHWKALSTNLFHMAGLQEMAETRVNRIMDVLGCALGDLLSPAAAKDTLYHKALLSIVRNAASLDRLFSGQTKWYLAYYPPDKHGTEPRPGRIRFATSNGPIGSDRFTVRPALCRAGGGDGEIYNSFKPIVNHVVKP
ncbi:hypothetical protein CEP52_002450 [Fusarium oligoseptatum]|uniref:Uncharacterized protein n=1 Tax=Fusarium oligoseptatum TaxID=2604345 RepID=A0A428UDF8_9HYPO|nr:hypothetical protein CEP52_002450 [Fusarium oligoseptatum]